MSQKIKIILFIIGVVLIGSLIFLLFFHKPTQTSNTTDDQNSQSSTNIQPAQPPVTFLIPEKTAPTMTLQTKKGNLQTNNLYQNPLEHLSHDGIVFEKNNDAIASFFPQDQGFLITLLNSDLEKARTEAENDFLQKLNITKDQACTLKVTLNTPSFVNQKAAGTNYGLSFCPNGKPLPKQ